MDGILIIDKPAGITSHDVVARCRRILKTKRIGHTGTLDPFATGVVVMLVGKATRLAQFLDKDAKAYDATVRLGFETDTGDLTGTPREPEFKNYEIKIEDIENVLTDFRGEIWQTPPMYSAKKIAGKKLYELARKGIEVERQAVKITIYELQMTNFHAEKKLNDAKLQTQDFGLRVSCSAGTYIRVLAEEIGRKLGAGAHLAALRRTRAGKFDLSRAVTLEELENVAAENRVGEILVSMNAALAHLPEVNLSADEIQKVRNGVKLNFDAGETTDNQAFRLIGENDVLLAVGFYDRAQKTIQPKVVLV